MTKRRRFVTSTRAKWDGELEKEAQLQECCRELQGCGPSEGHACCVGKSERHFTDCLQLLGRAGKGHSTTFE